MHEAREAAPVATTLRVPRDVDASELVARAVAVDAGVPLVAGGGVLAREMVRVNHYGADAEADVVRRCLVALGAALGELGVDGVDVEGAARVVEG